MAKGRPRSTRGEEYWRRVVRQQSASGGSVRDFCRRNRLREPTFYFWRRELLRRDDDRPAAGASFVPVSVRSEAAETAAMECPASIDARRIEIVLPGGQVVRVASPVDRQALADVLAVLEARPC